MVDSYPWDISRPAFPSSSRLPPHVIDLMWDIKIRNQVRNQDPLRLLSSYEPVGDEVTYVAETGTPMGLGLYASRDIEEGEMVARYRAPGAQVSVPEWERIQQAVEPRDSNFQEDSAVRHAIGGGPETVYLDAGWVPGSHVPKWYRMNHGPNPNAKIRFNEDIFEWHANRQIPKDEEIKFYYSKYVPPAWKIDRNPHRRSSIDVSNQVTGKRKRYSVL